MLQVPRAAVVIRACTVTPIDGHRHPVLAAAAGLATQHRQRAEAHQLACDPFAEDHVVAAATRSVNAAETASAVLVEQIDQWTLTALPDNRTCVLHTETFGHLIDRLIRAWARWPLLDAMDDLTGRERARQALDQVSELSISYDDLVADLLTGRRRLPRHQNPAGPFAA
ncbi:hypothetical protein GCM10010174_00190 [Kutzneria viridogrisea]